MEKNAHKLIIEANRTERNYWRDLFRFRELFLTLSWRDLKVRYKQTALGLAWSVVRPLLTMVIFTAVFSRAAGLKADDPSVPYALFTLAGILPWQFFANAMSDAGNSLVQNANLISKVYFPRMIVPASVIITSLVDFFITLVLMVGVCFYFQFVPSYKIIFLPFFILLNFLAVFGIGLYITSLNVQYRDFRYIIPFIVQFGLYVSPVGFGTQTLLSKLPPAFQTVFMLNPMVGIIDGFRWCFFENSPLSITSLMCAVGTITFFLVLGISTFRRMERKFADLV